VLSELELRLTETKIRSSIVLCNSSMDGESIPLKRGSLTIALALSARQVVGAPNLCSVPDEDYGPSAGFLFGDCVFTTPDPLSTALTTVRRNEDLDLGFRQ